MTMDLYTKHVSAAGKVSYHLYTPPEEPTQAVELTGEQIISLGVAASVTAMAILHRYLKPHQLVARKLKACEQAIFDLAQGAGGKVDGQVVDQWIATWNEVTLQMQANEERSNECKP